MYFQICNFKFDTTQNTFKLWPRFFKPSNKSIRFFNKFRKFEQHLVLATHLLLSQLCKIIKRLLSNINVRQYHNKIGKIIYFVSFHSKWNETDFIHFKKSLEQYKLFFWIIYKFFFKNYVHILFYFKYE